MSRCCKLYPRLSNDQLSLPVWHRQIRKEKLCNVDLHYRPPKCRACFKMANIDGVAVVSVVPCGHKV